MENHLSMLYTAVDRILIDHDTKKSKTMELVSLAENQTPKKTDYGTLFPLSASAKAGAEFLVQQDLHTELPPTLVLDEQTAARAITAHLPFQLHGIGRPNIADTDDQFRAFSLNYLQRYIRNLARHPSITKIILHPGIRRWKDELQDSIGTYERLVDGLQQVADWAAEQNLELSLENMRIVWELFPPDELPASETDLENMNNVFFGACPDEWFGLIRDCGRPNVTLCLDTSHVANYVYMAERQDDREKLLNLFLGHPELISHVHWSDSCIDDNRGRLDMHLSVGTGNLPSTFHRAIKNLKATLLLEHHYGNKELERELEYIRWL